MMMNTFLCSDVQVRGAYPGYALRHFENEGITLDWQPGDAEELKNGKTFIVKNADEVFKTHKVRFSHTGIIGKSQIYHIQDRDDRKDRIDHKSRRDKK